MTAHDQRLSLIQQIYTAAADESRWPVVLERLADEFRGGVAGLLYRTGTEGRVRSARMVRLDPALLKGLHTHYATLNPWVRATHSWFEPGAVVPLHQLVPLTELRRTEFYDGLLRPAGVWHAFAACVFRRGHDVLSFSVVRSNLKGPYDAGELESAHSVLPHIHRAVQVNQRMATLQRTHGVLADGLEHLRHGVVVTNRRGQVVFANRAARTIVAQRDGLTITRDGLVPAAPGDRRTLRALVDAAVRTGAGEGSGAGGTMTISRPSLKRPFLVLVAPLLLALDGGEPSGLATVFISDPEARTQPIAELARRMYGLTPTETHLASAFAASGSLALAADALHISHETARWHLKNLYRKTGTNRQSELLRRLTDWASGLVLDALPAAAAPDPRH